MRKIKPLTAKCRSARNPERLNNQQSNRSDNDRRSSSQSSTSSSSSYQHKPFSNNYNRPKFRQNNFDRSSRGARVRGHLPATTPIQSHNVNNIQDLSEDDMLAEFEAFYRAREHNNANDYDVNIIREVPWEGVNEMSTIQKEASPKSFLLINNNKINHLIDTGTNLNILSSSTYDSLSDKPLLKKHK